LRRKTELAFYAVVGTVALLTVLRPFWVAHYPPITDLPFHAAQTSVFRHYFDPSFHFREQFELTPLAVPYVSSYVLGAALMIFLPAVTAVKAATAIMLLTVPVGLGVLAWGTRKSPLLGLAGLPFTWCNLTHWGFINFVAALGMFAAVVGLAIRVLDRPSRRTQVALAATLCLLFFTHVYRFPFALCAVAGATLVMYPVTRRWRPVLLPVVPSLLLFVAFLALRPPAIGGSLGATPFELGRLDHFFDFIIGSFNDPDEPRVALRHLVVIGVVFAVSFGFAYAKRREHPRGEVRFALLSALVVLGCVGAFLLAFLKLPMEIGAWWYVYPREATAALFMAMGLLPDLPSGRWPRAALVSALLWSGWSVSAVVARNYEIFDQATRDFAAVSSHIPQSPKLMYLVFDHRGSTRKTTPFIHLPAYVQADKGGWLSFHFAVWDSSPVRYRRGAGAIVPPPVPRRWEWEPSKFDVRKHGPFFDWFLVRSRTDPGALFEPDAAIEEVHHEGTWWLYRRVSSRSEDATGRQDDFE